MFKKLETERLILRKLKSKDSQDLFEITNDPDVTKYVSWKRHENIEETIKYLKSVKNQYNDDNPYVWAIELKENGKMIGTIEFSIFNEKHNWCELDADLNKKYWGLGINTEALKRVLQFCFTELEIHKVQVSCYKDNIASVRVFEKVGMVYEGIKREHLFRDGKYHDLLLYSLLKEEYLKLT